MEFRKNGLIYFIRLEKGESLFPALETFAKNEQLRCGFIKGIGALKNTELGFYHLEKKHYDKKLFKNEAELLSLDGNLSLFEGKPIFHIHAVLGDEEFKCFGGHLFSAEVAVTVEIRLEIFNEIIERRPDDGVGLNLLNICKL